MYLIIIFNKKRSTAPVYSNQYFLFVIRLLVDAFLLVVIKHGSIRAFEVEGHAARAGLAVVVVAAATLDETVLGVTREQPAGISVAFAVTWTFEND